ncbi:transcription repressor NadR [Halalkalibacter hemicellulosilyticus]|nr:transcription repressor NadR [Halalkalibacter hemicellulosilyticus]
MHMSNGKKLLGEERRKQIINWLTSAHTPITGSELSKRSNVSRQVIVQDISILKAQKHPIIATAQGYLYNQMKKPELAKRMIACKHYREQAKEELFILVDHGLTVSQVMVEHAIYGEITASLMVSSRHEAEQFCKRVEETNSSLLSELTDGVHLHLVEAATEAQIDKAVLELSRKGFLLDEYE